MKDKNKYLQQLSSLYEGDHAYRVFMWLWEKVSNQPFGAYLSNTYNLTAEQQTQLEYYIDQLVHHHYPLQYILGTVSFGEIEVEVEPPVLIPRHETEEWVHYVLETLREYKHQPLRILDMCTGSGCIAIAFAHYFKNATVDAVDLYPKPLELTQKNALKNGCTNINVIQSDGFTNLAGKKYDLIFTNPPYIDEKVWQTLSPTVKEWEDKNALVAQNQGIALYQQLIPQSVEFLIKDSVIKNHARVYAEIGYDQGAAVASLYKNAGFNKVAIYKDLNGHDRMVSGFYK